ncbi:glycoside hydrolase family 13 protein [Saccharata proteae CBS 121410]|uniref:alpha-amylase n=1 Tax=Saccharata proteae CBS 121410 TaxID=1314787 RepID=A0A9P4HPY6_9PEZI|nr:glycoside hydrolase family 13 protein [Saccharata proteae CBS 121410]
MRIGSTTALLGLTVCATLGLAATPAEWRARSIYQVLTDRFAREDNSTTAACDTADREYCGGSWRGIINQLDYIQGMGFDAIWISPVTLNLMQDTSDGTSYHGYWQQNLYALNTPFGDADDLNALSTALHDRDMYLMVDVVVNHNGWAGDEDTVDYSDFYPFNSEAYYHPYCSITDYDNQTNVEDCWLGDSAVELVDLKTEDDAVANMYYTWITSLVANYSIDGLRIDTVKHVDSAFWPGFNAAAGVFCTGEVYDGDPAYTCPYQQVLDSVLNYMTYYPLIRAFESTSGSISDLVDSINTVKSTCKDVTLLGTFSENQDVPRFAALTDDYSQAKNVLAFTLLADGIPIIYAGQEQHYSGSGDPYNREATWLSGYSTAAELYAFTAAVNALRRRAIAVDPDYLTYMNYPIYSDTTTVAMRKGYDGMQVIAVLSNKGASGASYTQGIAGTGWGSGTAVVEVLSCVNETVDAGGDLQVPMASGLPRVYYPADQLAGSGICGL